MDSVEPRRVVLFVLVSAALLTSALLIARGGSPREPAGEDGSSSPVALGEVPGWAERTRERVEESVEELRQSASRFLLAFGRYEAGELPPAVRADLLATSTSAFGRELLAKRPPPPPLGFVPASRIARLDVRFISASGSRALVSGDLKRGPTPEEFGFLFVRREGAWLASGAGQ